MGGSGTGGAGEGEAKVEGEVEVGVEVVSGIGFGDVDVGAFVPMGAGVFPVQATASAASAASEPIRIQTRHAPRADPWVQIGSSSPEDARHLRGVFGLLVATIVMFGGDGYSVSAF